MHRGTYFQRLEERVYLSAVQAVETIWENQTVSVFQDSWMVSTEVGSEAERWFNEIDLGETNGDLGVFQVLTSERLGLGMFEVSIQGESDAAELTQGLSVLKGINYLEPNFELSTLGIPNDPSFTSLWGLHNTGQTFGAVDADIDAPEAWDLHQGNGQVIVAVIDSGIDYLHPDLAGNIWINPGEIAGDGIDNDGNGFVDDVHGYDFRNNDGDPMDDHSHGTHVAGTIGALGDNNLGVIGVNPNVQIMGLKFLGDNGRGSTADATRALNYLTMMKRDFGIDIRLSNNSWGGGSFSQSLEDAIAANLSQDILYVASAGNDSTDNDVTIRYPSSYEVDNVISVASTDHNDNLSWFSNFGASRVDLAAPGSSTYSTMPGGGYAYKSGTSMAAPHVSGALSLLMSLDPSLSGQEAKAILLDQVDEVASLNGLVATGGRLNVHSMLAASVTTKYVTNDLDSGAGSLRAALAAASGNSQVSTIKIMDGVGSVELASSLIYTGSQSLLIEGNQVNVRPLLEQEGLFNLFVSQSAADITLMDMTIEDGASGVVVEVPGLSTGTVALFLINTLVQNNALFGVHMNDKAFDSDAGLHFLSFASQFVSNGNGALDYDGVRIDEGGMGDARTDIINSAFALNGGDGLEVDETGDGQVATIISNSFFQQNGFFNPADLDDGIDVDEAGEGGVFVDIVNTTINGNADEGLDIDEAGLGSAAINLTDVWANFNQDEGVKVDEAGDGDLVVAMLRVESNQSAGEAGIALTESGAGLLHVIGDAVTADGNAKAGIAIKEFDAGHLYVQMQTVSTQFNGGDGFAAEENDAGDLQGAMVNLTTVGNGGFGVNLIQDPVGGDLGQFLLYYLAFVNTSGPLSTSMVSVAP